MGMAMATVAVASNVLNLLALLSTIGQVILSNLQAR